MDRVAVRNQLIEDEGIKYEVYQDHLGFKTYGIGHLVRDDDPYFRRPYGTTVPESVVFAAFDSDMDTAISECKVLYGSAQFDSWPGEVQEILVNMMFNMGRPRLAQFKNFRKALEEEDWVQAAMDGRDSLWYRQVTNRAERLMYRLENIA